jgi:hypothetical protein
MSLAGWEPVVPQAVASNDGDMPMKAMIALVVLLALGAAAQGKPMPVDGVAVSQSYDGAALADASAVNIGAAGATRETDYFRAPLPPIAGGRIFPCRLQLYVFEKTRLAQQSCN